MKISGSEESYMQTSNIKNKEFLIELCKYYMEFLESDFHTNRAPSRRINHNADDLKKIIELQKYNGLDKSYLKVIMGKFEGASNLSRIDREQHTIKLSAEDKKEIKSLIKDNTSELSSDTEEDLRSLLSKYKFVTNSAIDSILEDLRENIKNLDRFLDNLILLDYYDELFDLWKNKQLLEKEEIYLYFFEISYKDNTYPLFYMQLSINLENDGIFDIEYNPVLLVNKKALQYISEKYAAEESIAGRIDLPPRQIYLGNFNSQVEYVNYLQNIITEVTNFFKHNRLDIKQNAIVSQKKGGITLSNRCYLALFDKSDESIVNDYEGLLNILISGGESKALDILEKLGNDFLYENPKSFHDEIQRAYNSKNVGEKLTFSSPISLNKEQLQVLDAIKKKDCDKIIIQGPPGTGKSHTITAIIYNALLEKKSVLVVSDKREALDVVEDKIEQVLEKTKLDDYLQNPILRLGKKENNYNNIFKQANYEKIRTRFYAFSMNQRQIESEIESLGKKVQSDIKANINYELSASPSEINWFLNYEACKLPNWNDRVDFEEITYGNKYPILKVIHTEIENLKRLSSDINSRVKIGITNYTGGVSDLIDELNKCVRLIKQFLTNGYDFKNYIFSKDISAFNVANIESVISKFEKLKLPVLGYLLASKKLKELESSLNHEFPNSKPFSLKKDCEKIKAEIKAYRQLIKLGEDSSKLGIDTFMIMERNAFQDTLKLLEDIIKSSQNLRDLLIRIPKTTRLLRISESNSSSLIRNTLSDISLTETEELIKFLRMKYELRSSNNDNLDSYIGDRKELENRLILKMTNILDERVINFRENFKNDAEELKKIIKKKMQIDTKQLGELVKAFPCLIVNIRELGEYLPLVPNIFDLVIIDEASQVSIAQAFPAIIRGKKVVVLGDEQQFSNVKTTNASTAINSQLFGKVKDALKGSVVANGLQRDTIINKLDNFNIKNSILKFIQNIANYECMLKKHFRSYMEIIGYSNATFYNCLEIMKIRGKSINEVIQFHRVIPEYEIEKIKNTNLTEAEFIMDELERLKHEGFKGSIGIITPFTNQQSMISKMVYNSENYNYYRDKFKIKIMTFDSCQGEERDVIYYSMVEREKEDSLKYIFPVDFKTINLEEGGTLKAQRLNVGFSRAKESIRFVISKGIEVFTGEIGRAIRIYNGYLSQPDNAKLYAKVDPKSPMEGKVLNYLFQTQFYNENNKRIEIIPQFDVGKYIKQLDPYARIPNYRTDFLIIFKVNNNTQKFVIIEYDGFEHHFKNSEYINQLNYNQFYVESDIERQKTLELYGYRFIRINKFNLGDNPVQRLDERLQKVFMFDLQEKEDLLLDQVSVAYEGIENKDIKICPQCNKAKPIKDFYDKNLATGVGNKCMECKSKNKRAKSRSRSYMGQW